MQKNERKNIVRLIIRGQTNNFGNMIYDYANKLVITGLGTKASYFMGIYQMSETIVGIIFDILGGITADQKNRKKILILTDLLAALATFVVFLRYDRQNIWLLIITNVILAILYSYNSPTYKAIVKDLLSKKSIYTYNSYSKTISEIISVCSPLVGMFIISFFGFKYGMLINSLSFLFSAFVEGRFTLIVENTVASHDGKEGKVQSLKNGFAYIYNNKELSVVLIASSLINFFLAGYNFSIPFTNQMAHFGRMYAYVLVAESVGNILGALFNSFWRKNLSIKQYSHFLLGVSLTTLAVPLVQEYWQIILLLFSLSAACLTVFNIQMMSGIQSEVADDFIGRVFGVIFTIAVLFMPIGTYIFSLLNIKSWLVFSIIGIGEIFVYIFMLVTIKLVSHQ
ncbi:MFS transporter [Lactiplantibacillus paraplantarum]|uniref:MFS transporter n=1 Tax=Lactiplantibacillus paraplantarum TaxID=60520 RepID=UPI0023AAD33D|nr:MFS transporter [Lactiplantibacillus paraplantarum]WEE35740.1 MFS transporter [Lactiplantibacillus paraplantarum]